MFKQTIVAATVCMLGISTLYADINQTTHTVPQKYLSSVKSNESIIYARSGKESYIIGEPIGIEIKLRKDAFMYFWSTRKDGEAHLILPNDFELYNAYKKDISYTVPEVSADYSFVSNRMGVKEVYVLASPKKLTKANVEKIMTKNIFVLKSQDNHKSMIKTQKCGIMVIAKKPNYDIVNFKIIIYGNPNEVKNNMVVKIEPNPYGLE